MPLFEGNQGQGEEERYAIMAQQAGHAEDNTWQVASFLLPFLKSGAPRMQRQSGPLWFLMESLPVLPDMTSEVVNMR